MAIEKSFFGKTHSGESVFKYAFENKHGASIDIITYGGRIISLRVPNKKGVFENVVLGFDTLEPYLSDPFYLGALIGRCANRIAKGRFSIEGKTYNLETNNAPNHLHGGSKGFDKVVWQAEIIGDCELELSYFSKDGEEGYPGNLNVKVIYELTEKNALEVSYQATTDATTVVNLTQHAYFNLSGDFSKQIANHEISINADKFLPIDETAIPIGELRDVTNSPFDFREPKIIASEIEKPDAQLLLGKGFDHCWALNNNQTFGEIATAFDRESGRFLEVFTDKPGIQLYTGNFLGEPLVYRSGFCLETQHFPDAINQNNFPSVLLHKNEVYNSKTVFKFLVK